MRHIKYKHLKVLIAVLLLPLAFTLAPVIHGAPGYARVSADPHVTCGGASTYNPSSNSCTCPKGQVLVAGQTDTCAANCPANMIEDTDSVSGQTTCNTPPPSTGNTGGNYQCGSGTNAVKTSIDFGCKGQSCQGNCSAVLDVTFAIIRFLSYGVGLIVVASIIIAGIQYTTSGGDPQASAAATKRIQSTVVALIIYIFAYAILNYVIPAGFFKL